MEIKINESDILDFIAKNDKRYGSKLNAYKETIERLINENISINAIYKFIHDKDNTIGNKANFYKFINKNFKSAKPLPKPKTKQEDKIIQNKDDINTKTISIGKPKPKALDLLSQDYDLLAK